MADLDDLQLDKAYDPPPYTRRFGGWRVILVIGLVAAVGFLLWSLVWPLRRSAPVKVETEQRVAQTRPEDPKAVAGEQINLAPLGETDPIVRELVGRLSSHPKVAAWLATDQLLRNFTVVLINIADGRSPAQQLRALRPVGEFVVAEEGEQAYIDPRSYRRYDAYADAIGALDPKGTAEVYATLKPRIADAYREMGQPDGDADATLRKAIVHILETPVVEGDVKLASRSVSYEFDDQKLQSLSSAQRQFLRMGPRNMRIIKAKLRELAPMLGIAPETLPR
jgi:Protein of unknown function (DUF3014)